MKEVSLLEVSTPGCQHCAAFKAFWEEIKGDWPNVNFKEVSITEPEGQELIQKHQIFASPGIIINDELFATGGIDKGAFVKKLEELSKE